METGDSESGPRVVPFRAAPGVDLVADVWGEPGPVPVVLLHGLSQQRRFWGPVRRRLRTRPVAALDQRGHGDSDTPLSADFDPGACGADVVAMLDALGWQRVVVVGHSWGASVALAAAARAPERFSAVGLIDGGLRPLALLGPREEVRVRLTPPRLGIPAADLWAGMRSGSLAATWSAETQDALEPTFASDDEGRLRTRIGFDRHMRVLDGLLDHDPRADLSQCAASGVPVWAALCEPLDRLDGHLPVDGAPNLLIHRWAGAVHDVPLQWPALVAGFVDALVESEGVR